jgi:hypothetical protein
VRLSKICNVKSPTCKFSAGLQSSRERDAGWQQKWIVRRALETGRNVCGYHWYLRFDVDGMRQVPFGGELIPHYLIGRDLFLVDRPTKWVVWKETRGNAQYKSHLKVQPGVVCSIIFF